MSNIYFFAILRLIGIFTYLYKSIPSNNMYGCPVGTISTKCCDYLNIPMS
ncbi:hypothetical protein H8356DRAFT_1320988 [Neocallimastix lanati (nom. inval.)]|nr:hypothetical protein H8356DRAFT_1320988 [Neocallimastix sp. JGI-2020a]